MASACLVGTALISFANAEKSLTGGGSVLLIPSYLTRFNLPNSSFAVTASITGFTFSKPNSNESALVSAGWVAVQSKSEQP